jgi:hypothetical protein
LILFQEFLRDKNKVQKLAQFGYPLIRAIDGIAGERVSMRVSFTGVNREWYWTTNAIA